MLTFSLSLKLEVIVSREFHLAICRKKGVYLLVGRFLNIGNNRDKYMFKIPNIVDAEQMGMSTVNFGKMAILQAEKDSRMMVCQRNSLAVAKNKLSGNSTSQKEKGVV